MRITVCLVLALALCSVPTTSAFAREWKDSGGKPILEGDFVNYQGGKVRLAKATGEAIEVPIERLSEADRAFVMRTFSYLDEETNNSCRTAQQALFLYKAFISDPLVSETDRKAAREKLPEWEARAAKRMVRDGDTWVEPAEVLKRTDRARELIQEALRLQEVGQGEAAREKLEEASKVAPDDLQADFLLGLAYALVHRDAEGAASHFSECVRRNPTHIASLNNLALAEVRLEDYNDAVRHWQAALDTAPASPEIIQNIGRLLHGVSKEVLDIPRTPLQKARDLYASRARCSSAAFDPRAGWLYMRYHAPENARRPAPAQPPQAAGTLRVVAHGSGFVVHPQYVLTNRHVVSNSDGILVMPSTDPEKRFQATIAALPEDPDLDLALLRCEQLAAPPVRFVARRVARQGTEIRVIGYPAIENQPRPVLTATTGSVVVSLDEIAGTSYYLDAAANPGNSGGPICDSTGGVLGVLTAVERQHLFNYTLGIPHFRALAILQEKIPGFVPSLTGAAPKQDWPDIVDAVKRSTVLIEKQQRMSDIGLPVIPEHKGKWKAWEDPWCMRCYGHFDSLRTVRCPNRQCKNGKVVVNTQLVRRVIGLNPVNGQVFFTQGWEPVWGICPVCKGRRRIEHRERCAECVRGIDKGLL